MSKPADLPCVLASNARRALHTAARPVAVLACAVSTTFASPPLPVPAQRANELLETVPPDHRAAALELTPEAQFSLLAYLDGGSLRALARARSESAYAAVDPIDGPATGRDVVDAFALAPVVDPRSGAGAVLVVTRGHEDSGTLWATLHDGRFAGEIGVALVADVAPIQSFELAAARRGESEVAACFDVRPGFGLDLYCAMSTEGGHAGTWSTPQAIGSSFADAYAVALDAAGVLHVAWISGTSTYAVTVRRSQDGGASFDPAVTVIPSIGQWGSVELAVANDGSVLLASVTADPFPSQAQHLRVHRSVDGGSTWALALQQAAGVSALALAPDWDGEAVLLATIETGGVVRAIGSEDHGATWPHATTLATSALESGNGYVTAWAPRVSSTAPQVFLVAWTDVSDDPFERARTGVRGRITRDAGKDWDVEMRLDRTGGSTHHLSELLAVCPQPARPLGPWDVVIGEGFDHDSRAASLDLAEVHRDGLLQPGNALLEPNGDFPPPRAGYATLAAADGAQNAYLAFNAGTPTVTTDLYVARSTDRGRTLSSVAAVPGVNSGTRTQRPFGLAATASGRVYLAYATYDAAAQTLAHRVARSVDAGLSWNAADDVLLATEPATVSSPFPVFAGDGALTVDPANPLHVSVWFGAEEDALFQTVVRGTRSLDGGATFGTLFAEPFQNVLGPRACITGLFDTGPREYAIWYGVKNVNPSSGTFHAWPAFPGPVGGPADFDVPDIACQRDSGGMASAVFTSGSAVYVRRFVPYSWRSIQGPLSPAGSVCSGPRVIYSGGDAVVLVAFSCERTGPLLDVYVARSADAGTTFAAPVLLRSWPTPPRPSNTRAYRALALFSDNPGTNVWLVDGDVVSFSRDAGLTWQPALATGGYASLFANSGAATFPGRAVLGWSASRPDQAGNSFINVVDAADTDLDGTSYVTDCDDHDPRPIFPPVEVADVRVARFGALGNDLNVSWASQAGSNPTVVYDAVTLALSDLRATGNYEDATCRINDYGGTSYTEPAGGTPPGDGRLWLVRAQTRCGAATYGDSTLSADPRDALDAGGPCP